MLKKKPLKVRKVSFVAPDALARRLGAAAKANDRSLGAELRVRLEQTFAAEAAGNRAAAATTTTP